MAESSEQVLLETFNGNAPASPASGTNAAVVQTYAAAAAVRHRLTMLTVSYSGSATLPSTTAPGGVTITDGATTVFQCDITGPGLYSIPMPIGGLQGTVNTAMVITLAAGGTAVVGKLSTTKLTTT